MNRSRHAVLLPAVIALLTAGCDLGTKVWASHTLSSAASETRTPCVRRGETGPFVPTRIANEGIAIVPAHVELVYAENCVAAFGLLHDVSPDVRRAVLLVGALLALVAMFAMDRQLPVSHRLGRAALALIAGGGIGNLVDRVVRGYVVDFVYVHAGRFQWPIFNVADIAVVVGIGFLLFGSLVTPSPRRVS
jgi:signal peptidase II